MTNKPNPPDDDMTKVLWPAVDSLSAAHYALSVASERVGADTLLAAILKAESAAAEIAANLYAARIRAYSSGTDDDLKFVSIMEVLAANYAADARKLWELWDDDPTPDNPSG